MGRHLFSIWVSIVLTALSPARAAVRDVPVVPAGVVSVPVSAGASVTAQPLTGGFTLAAPASLPAPAIPAAADRPGALRYDPALPPEAARPFDAERRDGLESLRRSLEQRGDSESLALAERLHFTDPLTGLPNRAYLVKHGDEVLRGFPDPAVSLLDMNNFGAVNIGLADHLGVTKGRARADAVLAIAGAALGELAREQGVMAVRLGGEEFAVLGPREKVLAFAGAARHALPAERVLEAAGILKGGVERRAIEDAMVRLGRGEQPMGDFTYGVAAAEGRTAAAALEIADGALTGAKDAGGRGGIFLANADGSRSEWVPPAAPAAPRALPVPAPALTAESVARLEARLTPSERTIFREAAFKDPLTLARGYDYVSVRAAEWERLYAGGGGSAALISARNLKQINDLLGHDAGDVYLTRLGSILRSEVARARRARLDVQDPVRVASKEFLLVGRDAAVVARRITRAVEKKFDGAILSKAQVAKLRRETVERGLVPAGREGLIGTLRVLSEPLKGADGRVDVKDALDRAFERLESQKRSEDAANASPR